MERKVDAIEAFKLGYEEGQSVILNLVNKYCKLNVENVQQLIQAINAKEVAHDLYR